MVDFDKMENSLNQTIFPSWMPSEGDMLFGKVISRRSGIGQYNKTIYIIEIVGGREVSILGDEIDYSTGLKKPKKITEGTVTLWGTYSIDVAMKSVKDGDIVGIKFIEILKEKGKQIKVWKVVNEKGEEIPTFEHSVDDVV